MKYLKTKDGKIIDREKLQYGDYYFNEGETALYIADPRGILCDLKYEIIKQADTIEELVDCYDIYRKDVHTHFRWDGGINLPSLLEDIPNLDLYEIHACVWIRLPNDGWRLEPVARLNEERKLELL